MSSGKSLDSPEGVERGAVCIIGATLSKAMLETTPMEPKPAIFAKACTNSLLKMVVDSELKTQPEWSARAMRSFSFSCFIIHCYCVPKPSEICTCIP